MNILLDIHIILWTVTGDDGLSEKVRDMFLDPDNTVYYSAVSLWEVSLKHDSPVCNIDCTTFEYAQDCEGRELPSESDGEVYSRKSGRIRAKGNSWREVQLKDYEAPMKCSFCDSYGYGKPTITLMTLRKEVEFDKGTTLYEREQE